MTNISTATPAELRQTLRNMRAENLDVSTQLDLIHSDIIGMDPVTFKHNGGNTDPDQVATIRSGRLMVRCLAKNAARTAAKLRTASKSPARRAVTIQRSFPKFEAGMCTAAYIKLYNMANNGSGVFALPYNLADYVKPCTLYENGALDFDVIEEPADAPEATESAPAERMVSIVSGLTGEHLGTLPESAAQALAQRQQTTINPTAPSAYTIKTARYSKTGAMVIKTPSRDVYRTRASRLAATFGKYSHRQGGYVVTASGAAKFVELYAAGWDCSYLGEKASDRTPPTADQLADAIATHNTEAARQVSELIANATTAAAIEQASEATEPEHLAESTEGASACELATVDAEPDALATTCEDASSARHGATLQQGSTSSSARADGGSSSNGTSRTTPASRPVMPWHGDGTDQAPATPATAWHRPATAQTHIKSKSGAWSAAFYRNTDGAYVVRFESLTDGASWHRADTAGQRARMLQELARAADAHQPPAAAQPGAPGVCHPRPLLPNKPPRFPAPPTKCRKTSKTAPAPPARHPQPAPGACKSPSPAPKDSPTNAADPSP